MSLLHPQLAAFTAVLGEGSFEAAARRLSVTPSAISQRIKALEDRLGQVLILRQSPCRATPAGEHLLRGVRQMQSLEAETLDILRPERAAAAAPVTLAIAVNADSLATWLLGALVGLHAKHSLLFDLRVEDQDHSLALLRDGSVSGAITADAHPVPGCTVRPLGVMRYLPVAAPAFVARYFAGGLDAATLGAAPLLVFNRKDALQWRFMRRITRARLAPPTHYLPSSTGFVAEAALGLGWCMVPESMLRQPLREHALQPIAPGHWLDVPLFWQRLAVRSTALDQLGAALLAAARRDLRQRGASP